MSIVALLFPETNYPFLAHWCKRKLSTYESEYGGERAGVPKGEDIPFPVHKVKAALALLNYGAPSHDTLAAIAKQVRVSSPLLRVWRTEERFLALYRRAVWECADDFIRQLAVSADNREYQWPQSSPSEEFNRYGVALQQAILRRLFVDVIHDVAEWRPLVQKLKWLEECALVGDPPTASPLHSVDITNLLKVNAHLLLTSFVHRDTRDSKLGSWSSFMFMHKLSLRNLVKDALVKIEQGKREEAADLLRFIAANSPIDDVGKLYPPELPSGRKKR